MFSALAQESNFQEMIGVQIYVLRVSAGSGQLDLMGQCAVDVFRAEVVELVALLLPVDQRSIEIRHGLDEALDIARGQPLRILATLKRIDLPTGRAVKCLDLRQSLNRRLRSYRRGTTHRLYVQELVLTVLDEQFALNLQRLHGRQGRCTAAGFDILGYQLLESRRRYHGGDQPPHQ